MSVPHTFNPSDYQYLLRSLSEGSPTAKAEALKRFQVLASSDKKQFGVYAKRIILALQELLSEPKEEINIHASMLVLQIINLNPKDIQYYIKTKLLRKIVVNLGDSMPQLRKTSHYCLLAFIKTYKSIDQILSLYSDYGIASPEAQLRQKAINSFQSIAITDPNSLDWNSTQFKKVFEQLLQKLKDQSPFVQKASQQCLLSLSKMDEVYIIVKKLTPSYAGIYRVFCDSQRQLGNLQVINLSDEKHIKPQNQLGNLSRSESILSQKSGKLSPNALLVQEKMNKLNRQDNINKQALLQKIEQLRKNSPSPIIAPAGPTKQQQNKDEKPSERGMAAFSHKSLLKQSEKNKQKEEQKQNETQQKIIHPVIFAKKSERIDNVFGKKLFQDLRNETNWKIRLEAVEELATKFQVYKQAIEPDVLISHLLPPLIKLLSDQNFKISTITLKIFEELLKVPSLSLQIVAPQIVEKLGDGKVVLRQGIARLIRSQYLRLYNPIWIDCLLDLLKKALTPLLKQQILGILNRLYQDEVIRYPFDKIVELVSPLMEDPKTKVKIKTLDLLVKITIASQKVDAIKTILSVKLSQVYYQMFLEKVNLEMKNRVTPRLTESEPPPRGENRSLSFPSLRKHNNSANNTTSSSLQKYSKTIDSKPMPRATSDIIVSNQDILSSSPEKETKLAYFQDKQRGSFTPHESVRKKPVKHYKRRMQRTIQAKLALTHTVDSETLRPLVDPQKEIKTLPFDLKSEDWQVAFDGLTKIRRLLKFHTQFLTAAISRLLIVEVTKLVESLRSSLSKNAVITLGQCAQILGRALDPELDSIFSKLMRKTLDTNSFISQQVKKTLILVGTNCYESKVLSILVNYHTSRAIPVKISILNVLEGMTIKQNNFEKEPQKVVSILVDFMDEGALEIRDRAKSLLLKLVENDKQGKLTRIVPSQIFNKLKKRQLSEISPFKILKETSIQTPIKEPESNNQKEQKTTARKKRIIAFPSQFQQLEELLINCQTSQWRVRQSALAKIAAIVKTYPQQTSQHRLNARVIQIFAKQCNDPNSKVAVSALSLFAEIVPLLSKLIEANLSVLLNQLFACFAAQKAEIRQQALSLFDLIAQKVENWMMIQHLCTGVLYGHSKAKANVLFKIIKVLPAAFREKKSMVEKHIYSLINKLAEESKGDLNPILKELVSISLNLGGLQASSALKQSAKNLITS